MTTDAAWRRKWVFWFVGFTVFTVLVAVGGAMLGARFKSPEQAVADAQPPPLSLITAKVEKRVLTESVLLRGTVLPGKAVKVGAPPGLTGDTAVVTGVRATPGKVLAEGAVIVEVAGAPVVGLATAFPLYRDIHAGMSGPDVREVQRALRRIGYLVAVSGEFDAATVAGLTRFYADRGYQVPTETTPPEEPTASADGPAPVLPRAHVVRLDRVGRTISAVPVHVGTTLNEKSVLLELDVGENTIEAKIPIDRADTVQQGSVAEVVDDVRGQNARATVHRVDTEPTDSSLGTSYTVYLRFSGAALSPTPEHTVRVTIGAEPDAEPVLAVPLSAVYAKPDGSAFVSVAERSAPTDPAAVTDVGVRTGRSADGWVAVETVSSDAGVEEGAFVVIGRRSTGSVMSSR